MEVELGLGAILDIASGKEVKAGTDSILSQLTKPKGRAQIRRVIGSGLAVATTAVPIMFDTQGPARGMVWSVRAVSMTLAGGSLAAANTTPWAVYVTTGMPSLNDSEAWEYANAVPDTIWIGSGGLVLQHPEILVVGFKAAAGGATYIARAMAVEYPVGEALAATQV